jgi:hypothetical protein
MSSPTAGETSSRSIQVKEWIAQNATKCQALLEEIAFCDDRTQRYFRYLRHYERLIQPIRAMTAKWETEDGTNTEVTEPEDVKCLVTEFISRSDTLIQLKSMFIIPHTALPCLAVLQRLISFTEEDSTPEQAPNSTTSKAQSKSMLDDSHAKTMQEWITDNGYLSNFLSGMIYTDDDAKRSMKYDCIIMWEEFVLIRRDWAKARPPTYDLIYRLVESIITQLLEIFMLLVPPGPPDRENITLAATTYNEAIARLNAIINEHFCKTPKHKKEKMRELLNQIISILDTLDV